jgi:tryptophan 2,3-dioxygenase
MNKHDEHKPVYYGTYLQLSNLLNAQFPVSDSLGIQAHDEMLFIITHQAFELWFKQVMFEIDTVISLLSQDSVPEKDITYCVRLMQRVNKIMELTLQQFAVLETMTALDFMDFRDLLHPASGFQSAQFRILELRLGLNDEKRLNRAFQTAMHEEDKQAVQQAATKTTLFGAVQKWLENTPFLETEGYQFWESYKQAVLRTFAKDREDIARHAILTDEERAIRLDSVNKAEISFAALFQEEQYNELLHKGERTLSLQATLAALFINLYRDYPLLQQPFALLNEISAFDENFSVWRYRHAVMTNRMIGSRIGTGGSSGFHYLSQTAIKQKVFGDITSLAGMLIARRETPALPDNVADKLRFTYEVSKD